MSTSSSSSEQASESANNGAAATTKPSASSLGSKPTLRSFTEAVPLSLSSMAHMSLPLEEGVLDGMRQVLQHTLMACVQYARAIYSNPNLTLRDLTTSKNAWKAVPGPTDPTDSLPQSLVKLGFKHQYPRHCLIYLRQQSTDNDVALDVPLETELELLKDWTSQNAVLGRISLLYASTEMLTPEEMRAPVSGNSSDSYNDGDEMDDNDDDDDIPPTILYKVMVEYRSLPPTGNVQAVEAEELSMLSFGGSVDDDVKYGALASLYDTLAKYVLEIYSVRGKKYKFDLMGATLSNGTVPSLAKPTSNEDDVAGGETNNKEDTTNATITDPFSKSLCVTVTDHNPPSVGELHAITRMHLTLEGPLRNSGDLNILPPFLKYPTELVKTFALLDPNRSSQQIATSFSKQSLLLDPNMAGRVYVNGRLVIPKWGSDARIPSNEEALFGLDLLGIPVWHGQIVNYDVLKQEYGRLWQQVLVDARLMHLDIAGKLLRRLMYGVRLDENEESGYDDDDEELHNTTAFHVNAECLESQVMQSTKYDPVGICAKALATRFAMEYGKNAFPCQAHEVEWVKRRLGGKTVVVVPQRVISVLRRGGYFDVRRTETDMIWFFPEFRTLEDETTQALVRDCIAFLKESKCTNVSPAHIVFVDKDKIIMEHGSSTYDDDSDNDEGGSMLPITKRCMCRYNEALRQFHVNDAILTMDMGLVEGKTTTAMETSERAGNDRDTAQQDEHKKRAFVLGMYVAQEHPDGNVLVRYLLKHASFDR